MAKFTIKAKAEDVEKAGEDLGDFEVPKPGFYFLKIVEANPGYSKKKGTDEEDPDKPRIEVVYEIVGEGASKAEPKANYGRVWDYISFGDGYPATRRAELAMALDPSLTKADIEKGVDFDTDDMVEREVYARIKHEKDKRKSEEEKKTVMRARIALVLAADSADSYQAAEFDGDAYADADEEEPTEDSPFEGDEGGEDGGDDLLTQEELEGYDLKELGNVAKEFDLDPKESIVKFSRGANKGKTNPDKTKEKLIEAILEAQSGDEEPSGADEDDGDDDDPF